MTARHFLEIHVAGAPAERHELVGEQLTLGTAAEVSLRVRAEGAFDVPLLILALSAEGVQVRLPERVAGSVLFRGKPERVVTVPWGEDLYVGQARVAFLSEGRANSSSRVLFGALAVLLVVVGAAGSKLANADGAASKEVEPPPLAGAKLPCSEHEATAAERLARQSLSGAHAKQQRAAFDRGDGVEALGLLERAQACFEAAGLATEASAAGQELVGWRGQVEQDYAALRLRLRLALDEQRPTDALAAVHALEAMLGSQGSTPYAAWLSGLRRDLERRVAKGKR